MRIASDLMTSRLVTVSAGATVEQAAKTLVENHMSGAPVVEENGALVGIISEYQLLELVYDSALKSESVRKFMSSDVISVDANESINNVANLFVLHRIRRVPVMDGDRLVGIITRGDLLRSQLESDSQPQQKPETVT